jgi:hypothetical protein
MDSGIPRRLIAMGNIQKETLPATNASPTENSLNNKPPRGLEMNPRY